MTDPRAAAAANAADPATGESNQNCLGVNEFELVQQGGPENRLPTITTSRTQVFSLFHQRAALAWSCQCDQMVE